MAYSAQDAVRAAQAQADKYKREAGRLRGAIVEHFRQVNQGNWGHDDELWAEVGLIADPERIG